MKLANKIKTLNDKIKANNAQYSLDRKAAKLSALSASKFDKYEYLASEELIPKLGSIDKTRFGCSPLGQIFIKGLKEEEEDKK